MEKRRRIKAALLALDGGQGPQGGKRRELQLLPWDDHISQLTEQKFTSCAKHMCSPSMASTSCSTTKSLASGEIWRRLIRKMAKRAKWGYLVSAETKLAICKATWLGHPYPWSSQGVIQLRVPMRVDHGGRDQPAARGRVPDVTTRISCACLRRSGDGMVEWRGQVAAVDGVHFPMVAPSSNVVPDPMRYHVARKDEYALLCMALCDAEGSSWTTTSHRFRRLLIHLPGLCWSWVQGFSRGSCERPTSSTAMPSPSNSMITPSGGGADLDAFDYHQSSNRVAIERVRHAHPSLGNCGNRWRCP